MQARDPSRDKNPRKKRLHLPIVEPPERAAHVRKPSWLKAHMRVGENYKDLKRIMEGQALNTVCEEAGCPNIFECWEAREATFLILGNVCTRRCGFCDIQTGKPGAVDEDEPARVAEATREMGLKHLVLTAVARDDLPDGGASVWAACIRAVREAVPDCGIEVLPPDFKGERDEIAAVIEAEPDVFAHNLETVRRLHGRIRPGFDYDRTLGALRLAKELRPGQVTKSNLILGMGERPAEVPDALRDLRDAEVDLLTIGQYLQPTKYHLPVDRWVTPEEFDDHARTGMAMGFAHVEAGPLVRSSYRAGTQLQKARAG